MTIKMDSCILEGMPYTILSRPGIAPPAMERHTLGPLGITMFIIAWPSTVTKVIVTGTSEYGMSKEYIPGNEDNAYVSPRVMKCRVAMGHDNVHNTSGSHDKDLCGYSGVTIAIKSEM